MYIGSMKLLGALVVIILIAGLALLGLTYGRWEGQPPQIAFDREFKAFGKSPALALTVKDEGAGLKQVTITLKQKGQDAVLVEEALAKTEKSKSYDLGKLFATKGTQEGPAILTVSVTDHAIRNFMKGNQAEVTREFEFDLRPPTVEVLSTQHYINQGGSECVVYRVSDDTVASGVQVGPYFFPGYPTNPPQDKMRFALFAFKYDLPADTVAKVVARDGAGNEATASFWQKVFPKAFRSRDIPLEDAFLEKVVPEIMGHTPSVKDQGDMVKNFVEINSKLRTQNHETIAQFAKESAGKFLWDGAFLQLSNSKVESFFADRRTYVYKDQKVDQQDHVGFDLSVVQHYPIEAANDGKVIYADYFGIYGNTVLVDHGAGLISLYAHMSSIDVKVGQTVKKKDPLGNSGATGLAGGDHLHFGMFLQGVPINPTEWWDGKWIKDHVLDRFKAN